MVTRAGRASSSPDPDDYYEALQERWPAERPSRKRAKRPYRRQEERKLHVEARRLETPDTERMSRALLAARRELAKARADAEARQQATERQGDEPG